MLRRQNGTGTMDRPISRVWRVVTTCTLLGLTLGVATLRVPARGSEGEEPAAAPPYIVTTMTSAAGTPISPRSPGRKVGSIAFRPAATFRRMDSSVIMPCSTSSGY